MTRPVHYAAAFVSGLTFGCYRAELRAHRDAIDAAEVPGPITSMAAAREARRRRRIAGRAAPSPRSHTDLRRVTCPECWNAIRAMARAALNVEAKGGANE